MTDGEVEFYGYADFGPTDAARIARGVVEGVCEPIIAAGGRVELTVEVRGRISAQETEAISAARVGMYELEFKSSEFHVGRET